MLLHKHICAVLELFHRHLFVLLLGYFIGICLCCDWVISYTYVCLLLGYFIDICFVLLLSCDINIYLCCPWAISLTHGCVVPEFLHKHIFVLSRSFYINTVSVVTELFHRQLSSQRYLGFILEEKCTRYIHSDGIHTRLYKWKHSMLGITRYIHSESIHTRLYQWKLSMLGIHSWQIWLF